jgi:hypothetical protein
MIQFLQCLVIAVGSIHLTTCPNHVRTRFVRTDQIEGYRDENGEHLDPSLIRVIEPKVHVLDNGDIFPFIHSTGIFPEWPFAALGHVHPDVMEEVQDALLALGRRSEAAQGLEACPSQTGMTAGQCNELPFPDAFSDDARCDTTKVGGFACPLISSHQISSTLNNNVQFLDRT